MKDILRILALVILFSLINFCKKIDNNPSKIGDENGIKDGDGNLYTSVKIGTQEWLVENLKTTRYNNGDSIGSNTSDTGTYDDLGINVATYGRLYTWYTAIDARNVCPIGWHIPGVTDWTILADYLGGEKVAGAKLKETGTWHWNSPNNGATNETGFLALPGGDRNLSGGYDLIGRQGFWWSSTKSSIFNAWAASLSSCCPDLILYDDRLSGFGYSIRCLKGAGLPIVTTLDVSAITQNSMSCGGDILNDGGTAIIARGVCWSTFSDPTISDYRTADGTGIGKFSSSITGLTKGTLYYFRAYATNIVGTTYGNQFNSITNLESDIIIFNPGLLYGSVSDINGNTYKTIQIGTQIWMAENLKTIKSNDDITTLSNIADNIAWKNLSTPAYCWYNNDEIANKNTYGAIYNWGALERGKLCPVGWHVPFDSEWAALVQNLGGDINAVNTVGFDLRETGPVHWIDDNIGVTNKSGFTGLPGGQRSADGAFLNIENRGVWWSASGVPNPAGPSVEGNFATTIILLKNSVYTLASSVNEGASVRCIKNNK